VIIPALLRARSSDEYAPLPWSPVDRDAIARYHVIAERDSRRVTRAEHEYALDRRGTAASLRAIDAAHGGGFYMVPERATHDLEEAEAAFVAFANDGIGPERIAAAKSGGPPLPSLHSSSYLPQKEPTLRTGVLAMTAAAIDLLSK